jgi:nitroimidazol reductase NimA-like FMN-containing flavoprotein (pyridoxamine 5'-phosphate oxidase superfamily)
MTLRGRTTVRRLPEKQRADRAVLDAVLDEGLVGHLAVVDEHGQPYVLPVGYARDGDRVLVHGSTASRLFRALAAGAPTCFTVTLLDGLVVARSAFESSMHYRSVLVLGRCTALEGEEKVAALRTLTEHLIPQRWDDVRPPLPKELAATTVLALPLEEWSAKVSDGQPDDGPEDVAGLAWAGTVALRQSWAEPVPAADLAEGIAVPAYLRR